MWNYFYRRILGAVYAYLRPEQSGKTFVMIQQIIKDFTEPCDGKEVINIIFCDNNLLLTKQTSERVKNDLKEIVIHGEEGYVEFSRGICVPSAIRPQNPSRDPVRSATSSAVPTGSEFPTSRLSLRTLIAGGYREKFVFKIWLDEADKFDKFVAKKFIPLAKPQQRPHILPHGNSQDSFRQVQAHECHAVEKTTAPHYHVGRQQAHYYR